jgi:anti-sigma regulatory factor (Ser/Thr protein kinase)
MQNSESHSIEVAKIREALKANLYVGDILNGEYVSGIYASDLMSDVLAYGKAGSLLLTGLNSIQAAISAYMSEFRGVIFIRNKVPDSETIKFSKDKNLIILSTEDDMFDACVKIAQIEGEIPETTGVRDQGRKTQNITTYTFKIEGKDFANAGLVSTQIKTILKSIGYDPQLIRRVAISTYEAEMNVVMHAKQAEVTLMASDKEIQVTIRDEGKGIKDINLAMTEGYSTATEEQRAMGFGAGMGLPNIKKNSDELHIESEVNKGTTIEIFFHVQ